MKTALRTAIAGIMALTCLQVMASTASAGASIDVPMPANPFGAQFGPDANRFAVSVELGSAYLRTGVTVEGWNGRCYDCREASNYGLQTVLRIKANGGSDTPSKMPSDLAAYRSTVTDMAVTLDPAVVVIENEPDGSEYWSGTAAQYENLLAAGCEAAHSAGVPCTGGGISSATVTAMVYQSYVDAGNTRAAKSYARKIALSDAEYNRIVSARNASKIRSVANKGHQYLDAHVTSGADLVNFHWYRSAEGFGESVDYLVSETGLPPMSNEIGQYTESGSHTTALMDAALAKRLRFAIWMSMDVLHKRDNRNIVALQNPDGTLRPSGRAFQSKTRSL